MRCPVRWHTSPGSATCSESSLVSSQDPHCQLAGDPPAVSVSDLMSCRQHPTTLSQCVNSQDLHCQLVIKGPAFTVSCLVSDRSMKQYNLVCAAARTYIVSPYLVDLLPRCLA